MKIASVAEEFSRFIGKKKFATIVATRPGSFRTRRRKVAPEAQAVGAYSTLTYQIKGIPVEVAARETRISIYGTNALLAEVSSDAAWGYV